MPRLIPPPNAGYPRFEITDKVLKIIEESAKFGLGQGQIAAILGISADTFSLKIKENPNISLVMQRGLANSNKSVAASILNNALPHTGLTRDGKEVLLPGETDAAKFWISRRGGPEWKENAPLVQVAVVPIFATQYTEPEKDFLNGNGRTDQGREGAIDADSGDSAALEAGQVERDSNQAEDE